MFDSGISPYLREYEKDDQSRNQERATRYYPKPDKHKGFVKAEPILWKTYSMI